MQHQALVSSQIPFASAPTRSSSPLSFIKNNWQGTSRQRLRQLSAVQCVISQPDLAGTVAGNHFESGDGFVNQRRSVGKMGSSSEEAQLRSHLKPQVPMGPKSALARQTSFEPIKSSQSELNSADAAWETICPPLPMALRGPL